MGALRTKLHGYGDYISDRIAKNTGSWPGIICLIAGIVGWILYQKVNPFDPKPYILLNLMLSISASLQGPFILMSQRKENNVEHQELLEKFERQEKVMRELLSRLPR